MWIEARLRATPAGFGRPKVRHPSKAHERALLLRDHFVTCPGKVWFLGGIDGGPFYGSVKSVCQQLPVTRRTLEETLS